MKLDMDNDGIHGTLELENYRMRVVLENVAIEHEVDYYTRPFVQAGPATVTMQLRVTGEVVRVSRPQLPPVQFVGGYSTGPGPRMNQLAFNSSSSVNGSVLYGHAADNSIVPRVVPPTPVPAPDEPLPLRTIELGD